MMDFKVISDFLDLVRNPDKYEAALKAIQSKEDSLKATIKNIDSLNKIDVMEKKAAAMIDAARVEAEKIKAEAQSQVVVMKANASKEYDAAHALMKKAQELEQRSKELIAETTAKQKEQLAAEKAIAKGLNENAAKEAVLTAKEVEINERLAKLRQVMS